MKEARSSKELSLMRKEAMQESKKKIRSQQWGAGDEENDYT